jgi:hypothetical protein
MLQLSAEEARAYTDQDLLKIGRVFNAMQSAAAPAAAAETGVACDLDWHVDLATGLRETLRMHPLVPADSSAAVEKQCYIHILAASNDKLVPLAASEWLTSFYGNDVAQLTILDGKSHGGCITGGGPTSKPAVYEQIARGNWGLVQYSECGTTSADVVHNV